MVFKLMETANTEETAFERMMLYFNHSRRYDACAVQHHYDLSNEVYKLFLDENLVYSCAYFETGEESLEEAQIKKIDHIFRKIQLQPGHCLLDVGCGYGTVVIRAAQKWGARCVGVTIAKRQYELACERVKALGLEDLVEIRLQDYRDLDGKFDRIVSIGMYEHVGSQHLPSYFAKLYNLLVDDGVCMSHGVSDRLLDKGLNGGAEFIQRYVFPGTYLPPLSVHVEMAERGGFEVLDVECLRRHYTKTLVTWAQRFEHNADEIRRLVGEEKYRVWRVYLAGCVYSFGHDHSSINQVLLKKAGKHADITHKWNRHYMYDTPKTP